MMAAAMGKNAMMRLVSASAIGEVGKKDIELITMATIGRKLKTVTRISRGSDTASFERTRSLWKAVQFRYSKAIVKTSKTSILIIARMTIVAVIFTWKELAR